MVENCSSCPGTQYDQLSNKGKPAITFDIEGLERFAVTTFEK